MTTPYIILILLVVICMIITYILVYRPENNIRFKNIVSRLNFLCKQVFLLFILLLSAIPSILVIQDRWLGYNIGLRTVDYIWWDSFISFPLVYPRYFLFIFVFTASTWLIVFFWQNIPAESFSDISLGKVAESEMKSDLRGASRTIGNLLIGFALGISAISAGIAIVTRRIPGWELLLALGIYVIGWIRKDYETDEIKQYILTNGAAILDVSLFVVSLCGILYALFGESQHVLILYVLFVLSAINLYKRQKSLPVIFWICVTSLLALTWKINGWEYVVIGDEYSFYAGIREILENRTLWELINTTFYGNFVYGTHPYFSSYIHNFFMKLFGNHNFGWRFSNPFLVSASLYFYYYFFKSFISKSAALTTVILLGFSHYLLSFAKIGYNNLQAFFALGLVLGTLAWALKSMKLSGFIFLGLSMGLCFYIYPAALYILPLPVVGMFIYLLPVNKDAIKRWGWMALSTTLLIYPLFIQPQYWTEKIPGTFLYSQTGSTMQLFVQNIISNLFYSIFSYLYTPNETHYVSTGYMDPLSSIFIVIGAAILIRMLKNRDKSSLFLSLGFLALLIPVGLTHGRIFPTTTRMFLLLPWFALFATLGIEWFISRFSMLFSANSRNLLVVVIGAIVLVNLYNAYVIDIRRSVQYHTMSAYFVKTVRQINEKSNLSSRSYYFVSDENWNTSNMIFHQWVYLVPDSPRQIISLFLDDNQLPLTAREIIDDRDAVVIVRNGIDPKIVKRVDAQLQVWGKELCEIKSESGYVQFQLWHSGDLDWLCE